MTYYCFNRCTEENFRQIENLLSEYPFEQNDSDSSGSSLTCCPFTDPEDKLFVSYRKFDRHGYPLVVQTHPGEKIDFNNNEQFKSILNRLIRICNPTSICDFVFREHDWK